MKLRRVAALYDIHGNLPALEAVLDDLDRAAVDHLVVGGDVFPGPMASECLDRLLEEELPVSFIHGNGDRAILALAGGDLPDAVPEAQVEKMRAAAAQLQPRHVDVLSGWPATARLDIGALGEVLFCHATPRSDTEIFTRRTDAPWLEEAFSAVGADTVLCGHTHMPFDRCVGEVRVVNPGSVGMPFGEPGAYWGLLGEKVERRRTAYDLDAAAERIRATGRPGAAEFADDNVLRPPSAEQMLELFEAAASAAGSAK